MKSLSRLLDWCQVEGAEFMLEVEMCPAGYVLRSHATQTGLSVCTCNEEIADLLLCEDDQQTVVVRVSSEREGREGRERQREMDLSNGRPIFLLCLSLSLSLSPTARKVGSLCSQFSAGQPPVLSLSHWLLSLSP